jgi:hypothetical protein
MDNYFYFCHHCGKEYIPKRRYVQKYCSNSCRTNAFVKRVKSSNLLLAAIDKKSQIKSESTKIDKMSLAGVGNAVAGTAIIKMAESLFTSEINKPATKGDLKKLESIIVKRYYPVYNLAVNINGQKPYFDIQQNRIVYF